MTSEEFEAAYRPLHQLSEDGAHTRLAAAESGAIVMVHLLDVGTEERRRQLLEAVGRLSPEGQEKVLAVLDVDAQSAVVTRFIMDFVSFPRWLEENGAVLPPEPAAAPAASSPEPASQAPPAPTSPEPGEFTRMFRAALPDSDDLGETRFEPPRPVQAPVEPPAPPPIPPLVEESRPAPELPPAREETPATLPGTAGGAVVPDLPEVSDMPAPGQGEFTRLFRAATSPPVDEPQRPVAERVGDGSEAGSTDLASPSPPPEPHAAPGEFTAMFRSVPPPQSAPVPPPPAVPPPAAVPPPPVRREEPIVPPLPPPVRPSAGEFTGQFGAFPSGPSSPGLPTGYGAPQPPGAPVSDGYLDRLRNSGSRLGEQGRAHEPAGIPPVVPPFPSAGAPPAWSGAASPPPDAGAYTRMISAQAPPPPPVAAPRISAAPVPPSTQPPNRLPVLIALFTVAFLAFAIILYLVLKSQLAPADPAAGAAGDSVTAVQDSIAP